MIERRDLERMRDWAHEQVAAGNDPSWAWYQHMKLRETLDAILTGMDRAWAIEPGRQAALVAVVPSLATPIRKPQRGGARPVEPVAG
jgi:hypothetical protein